MESTVCFTPVVKIPFCDRATTSRYRAKPNVCTLAPDKRKERKPSSPQTYRVLPDDLNYFQRPPRPPQHWSIPIIGIYIEQALGIYKSNIEKRLIHGPIHTSNFLLGNRTYICDYHTIMEVLRDTDVFRSKGAIPTFIPIFGDDAMVVSDGADHAIARAAFAPAFSPRLFPYYFKRAFERTNKTWESVRIAVQNGDTVRLAPVFRKHYLSIIIEMTTGLNMDDDKAEHMRVLFHKAFQMFYCPKIFPAYKEGERARDEIMTILGDLTREKLANHSDTIEELRQYGDDTVKLGTKDIRHGNVDMLMVSIANSSLSTKQGVPVDENVVGSLSRSILLLWFAGFMTAAVTSMNASFELGLNSDLYDQLLAEQDSIVDAAGGNKEVTYEQTLSEMPLLESFLTEILRIYPAARGIPRKVSKNVEILGHFVPKDSIVFCSFMAAHRDPAIYDDPDTLKPDRFLKKSDTPKPPNILTFGTPGSIHYCMGAAFSKVVMKTTFATLLRDYSYSLDNEQSKKYQTFPEPSPESGVILKTFQRRKER